jgi:hypothetical protein
LFTFDIVAIKLIRCIWKDIDVIEESKLRNAFGKNSLSLKLKKNIHADLSFKAHLLLLQLTDVVFHVRFT